MPRLSASVARSLAFSRPPALAKAFPRLGAAPARSGSSTAGSAHTLAAVRTSSSSDNGSLLSAFSRLRLNSPSLPLASPSTTLFSSIPRSTLPSILPSAPLGLRFRTYGAEYQPSQRIRKRRHGFLARRKSRTGRKIIVRRLIKGRRFLTH